MVFSKELHICDTGYIFVKMFGTNDTVDSGCRGDGKTSAYSRRADPLAVAFSVNVKVSNRWR